MENVNTKKDVSKEEVKKDENMEKKKLSGKKKSILFIILLLIISGIGVGVYYYIESNKYFVTDNAKVMADLKPVTSLSTGRVVKLNVLEGDFVNENEVIGRLQNGSYLRTPINGQVVKTNVVLNQIISPSTVAFVIADVNNIYVSSNIEETDITKIKTGQLVEVQLDAYLNKSFKAHVEEIDKVTQSALSGKTTSFSTSGTYTKVTQLIPVKILIDEEVDLNSLIGTNSTVKIKIK